MVATIAAACAPASVFGEAPNFSLRRAPQFTEQELAELRFLGVPFIQDQNCAYGTIYMVASI